MIFFMVLLYQGYTGRVVESTIRSSVHNWLGDNTGKLHFDNMILTDSILSLDTEIKRIPYYVFMAHIDLTGRIFD